MPVAWPAVMIEWSGGEGRREWEAEMGAGTTVTLCVPLMVPSDVSITVTLYLAARCKRMECSALVHRRETVGLWVLLSTRSLH
jgi:hypothetical protein